MCCATLFACTIHYTIICVFYDANFCPLMRQKWTLTVGQLMTGYSCALILLPILSSIYGLFSSTQSHPQHLMWMTLFLKVLYLRAFTPVTASTQNVLPMSSLFSSLQSSSQTAPQSGFPAWLCISVQSVSQFSRSVVSDSATSWTAARKASLSITNSWVYLNSCPSSWWCHLTISSSVVTFSSCPKSFPAWGSFPMSQFFTSGGQSTGVSASASVLPMNIQDWFTLGWIGCISLQSKRLSRVFSNTIVQKHQFLGTQLSSQSNSHILTWPHGPLD